MTWWDSEESFQAWVSSQDFAKGHAQENAAQAAAQGGGHPGGHPGGAEGGGHPGGGHGGPVASGSEVLGFEVVERIDAPAK